MVRILGRTERRVVAAILATALIPLVGSLLLGRWIVTDIWKTAYQPELGVHLERALGVYADLAKSIKQDMRHEADAIAASSRLHAAAASSDEAALGAELASIVASHPALASISVETSEGRVLASHARGRPVDKATERTLAVRRPLGEEGDHAEHFLAATFTTPSARFEELESAEQFAKMYRTVQLHLDRYNVYAMGALLGLTIVAAVVAGTLVVRPVTRRIRRLAAATRPVAEGDLTVRVADAAPDEVGELGRAFDRMLEELERSRARIEFLKRMGEWQNMARHLAHEIKNPLTPIQLAVEECHRRCPEGDPAYKDLVQTTLEVVEEEIGSLRRLVGEFSSFARLPRAELSPGDLAELLREQRERHLAGAAPRDSDSDLSILSRVAVSFEIPSGPMPAVIDREMLRRVLSNLLRNAAQALRDARSEAARGGQGAGGETWGKVVVSASVSGAYYVIDVDDDGPGIGAALRPTIFDPYVTTKSDGTGLGLAIVKKIVVDHGGTIDAASSPLGGARFRVRLPRAGTPEARVAAERLEAEQATARVQGEAPGSGSAVASL